MVRNKHYHGEKSGSFFFIVQPPKLKTFLECTIDFRDEKVSDVFETKSNIANTLVKSLRCRWDNIDVGDGFWRRNFRHEMCWISPHQIGDIVILSIDSLHTLKKKTKSEKFIMEKNSLLYMIYFCCRVFKGHHLQFFWFQLRWLLLDLSTYLLFYLF